MAASIHKFKLRNSNISKSVGLCLLSLLQYTTTFSQAIVFQLLPGDQECYQATISNWNALSVTFEVLSSHEIGHKAHSSIDSDNGERVAGGGDLSDAKFAVEAVEFKVILRGHEDKPLINVVEDKFEEKWTPEKIKAHLVKKDDDYSEDNASMCFTRFHESPNPHKPVRVLFQYHNAYHVPYNHEETPDAVSNSRKALGDLLEKLRQIETQQETGLARGAVQRNLAESISTSVMWWTVLEGLCILSLGALHLRVVKNYFEVKQCV